MTVSLSHSSLEVYRSCKRRYKLSRIDGIERRGNPKGLRRGAAFSDALEHRDVSMIHKAYDQYIMDAVTQPMVDDLIAEREIVDALYRRHVEHFGDDDEREIEFDFPIENAPPGYRNRGRIDGINWQGSRLVIEEDKLMSQWTNADEAALPLNGQVLRYLGAARMLYPQATDIALRYRVTRYPGTYKRKDETAAEYGRRVVEQVQARKPQELFAVPDLIELSDPVIAELVADYYADLASDARDEARRRAEGDWPAANGNACKAYGGCEFLPACKRVPNYEELFTQKERESK